MPILKIFLSFEVILQIIRVSSYGSVASLDPSHMEEQNELDVLRCVIDSEDFQVFIPPEFVRMAHYCLIDKYDDRKKVHEVLQYLLRIGKTNFQLDEDEILEQSSSLYQRGLDFEDIRCLLWAKGLGIDAFLTARTESFFTIVNCCQEELRQIPVMTVNDFLKSPTAMRCWNQNKKKITVFTPTGESISLPANATPIDFAYRIHTEVGNRCSQALVNGSIVPLNARLEDSDLVEILKVRGSEPKYEWLQFTVTKTAKNSIRR